MIETEGDRERKMLHVVTRLKSDYPRCLLFLFL